MDLNLIRTFTVIYELKSVSEAANFLNITQPSVSYALKKLRQEFNDDLFVRDHSSMIPTKKADFIYKTFSQALYEIDNLISHEKSFDAASSTFNFVIAASDLGTSYFIPALFKYINQVAPNISLEVIQLDAKNTKDWLNKGIVDIVICNKLNDMEDYNFEVILKDHYVGITHNPAYNIHNYKEAQYILVSSNSGHKRIEAWMKENKLKISLKIPNFHALPYLLKDSSHIAIVPKTLAKLIHSGMHNIDFSKHMAALEVGIYKNKSAENSHVINWLIQIIKAHFSVD